MAITFDAGTNTITVTGGTPETPLSFTDIYDADVAGGWGKVTRLGTNQFYIAAKIIIGDGVSASYLTQIRSQLTFASGLISSTEQNILSVLRYSIVNFGILDNPATKMTSAGCSIQSLESTYLQRFGITYFDGPTVTQCNLYSCEVSGRIEFAHPIKHPQGMLAQAP